MEPKQEIEKEQKELERLLQLREQTEVAIAKAKRRLAAWMEILDDTETGALAPDLDLGGLTDACRTAMRASRKEWLTTTEIMSALKELGFPIHEYKAPMASITTTVNRLAKNGEVVPSPRSQPGATEYKWVGNQVFSDAMQKSFAETVKQASRSARDSVEAMMHASKGAAERTSLSPDTLDALRKTAKK
jgi:hypothetical protein